MGAIFKLRLAVVLFMITTIFSTIKCQSENLEKTSNQTTAESTTAKSSVSDEALEQTLKDRRYLQRLLKCATGEAPCDSVGRRLKSLAPLVLRGTCPQCTEKEQKQIKKVLAYVQVNFPKEWNKLLQQNASG